MFHLQLAHLDHDARERDLEADLRRRQLLKAGADAGSLRPVRSTHSPDPRTAAARVPATQR